MNKQALPGDLTPGLSVVIPVYNSEGSLRELAERLEKVLGAQGRPFEVIMVEDGSRDESWKVAESLAQQFGWLRGIRLMRNYGQHNALLCGIRQARYDIVVTLDDDLQNPPEEIPKLLNELDLGCDVVYGAPERQRHSLWRSMASSITKLVLQGAMGVQTARKVSSFRAFRTRIRAAFADYRGPFPSIDVLLTWGARQFSVVVVKQDARKIGETNYTFFKLIVHALNMMTGFSVLPLQLTGLIGLCFAIFGFCVLGVVLIRYMLEGTTVAGFPFLASIIAIFSGVQLFAIGVIGEYLARMHFRMMERPAYAVLNITEPTRER